MTQEERVEGLYNAVKATGKFECTLGDILEAISEHYDFTPKVKELVWLAYGMHYKSDSLLGVYNVEMKAFVNVLYSARIGSINLGVYETQAEAQSACQEHYRTTVLSLLEL